MRGSVYEGFAPYDVLNGIRDFLLARALLPGKIGEQHLRLPKSSLK
jgi:hypothetical protein